MDNLRTGYNPDEKTLGPTTVGGLSLIWEFDPGAYETSIDPAVNPTNAGMRGQVVVAHGVRVAGKETDLVLIGDGNGYFFALDANSRKKNGTVVWYKFLGTRVTDCNPILGVQATGAVVRTADKVPGAVYIGLNGQVHALQLTDGSELPGWPVVIPTPFPPSTDTDADIHDGANIVDGELYLGTSGHCDANPYYGRVVQIDTGAAKLAHVWFTMTGSPKLPTIYGGGVWGWGGVSVDPTANAGGVYVATGNAKAVPQQQGDAEKILDLGKAVSSVAGVAGPKIPGGDNDYGSTPVVFQPEGCSTKLLAAVNKTGLLVLEAIGADGKLTVRQSLKIALATTSFIGMVAWDPVDQLLLLTTPTDGPAPYVHGLNALRIDPSCGDAPLSLVWQTTKYRFGDKLPVGNMSSPTVANGLAWFGVGIPGAATPPRLLAVATANGPSYTAGQVMWQSGPLACFPKTGGAPTVVNGQVFITCYGPSTRLYAFALPGS
jgi:hypothetical protein